MEEQTYRDKHVLNLFLWRDICTKDYNDLSETMKDLERIEAAHRTSSPSIMTAEQIKLRNNTTSNTQQPVPKDIGNVELKEPTKEKRGEYQEGTLLALSSEQTFTQWLHERQGEIAEDSELENYHSTGWSRTKNHILVPEWDIFVVHLFSHLESGVWL